MLRFVAWLLVRGPESHYVRGDLEETWERDLNRGVPASRAGARYLNNTVGSALEVVRARRIGGMRGERVRERMGGPRRVSLGISFLDVKLALRMLRKDPALTLVAVFALSIGIPFGLAPFQFLDAIMAPLPVHEGHRVLGLRNWDVETNRPDDRSLHDYETWRAQLESFESVGATRSTAQNLIGDDGEVMQLPGAIMSASGFEVLAVPPHLGRPLLEADDRPGAPPVVVLAYDAWRSRFGGDPEIVGTTIQLADARRTVVGVMPDGFLFPVRSQFWIPLSERGVDHVRGEGPPLWVFGRLAEGVSRAEAQAEIAALGTRTTASFPETHEHLRAEVELFSLTVLGDFRTDEFGGAIRVKIAAILLLAIACGNVGTLLLARAAKRTGEIAVRTALGASRLRIIVQLFIEALVIALVAMAVGLTFADWLVGLLDPLVGGLPYWMDFGVQPRTIVIALSLAVFSAIVAGVIPALKATGRGVQGSLQRAAAGRSGMRFGALSTVLIVSEVALSVAFLSPIGGTVESALVDRAAAQPLPADEILVARLSLPPTVTGGHDADRFGALQDELLDRLAAERDVRRVALATVLPGMDHPSPAIEVEGETGPNGEEYRLHVTQVAYIDVDFFQTLDVPIRAGRDFDSRDIVDGSASVIVNQPLVDELFGGRSPIGRRIRYPGSPGTPGSPGSPGNPGSPSPGSEGTEAGPWHEIVGVVDDFGMNVNDPHRAGGLYHPMARGETSYVRMALHVGPDPTSFAPRMRSLTASVDPTTLVTLDRLDRIFSEDRFSARWLTLLLTLLASISVVLSAAGLYALMSFTVSERTREIGIRSALGAHPGRIVHTVLGRAATQLVLGVGIGVALATVFVDAIDAGFTVTLPWPLIYACSAAIVMAIGLLACARPTARGLRIQPSEALREN